MALNKTEAMRLAALEENVALLMRVGGLTFEQACAGIEDKIAQFEADTRHKIIPLDAADTGGGLFSVVDLSRDFIRVRKNSANYTVLRSRSLGVTIDVRVAREGAYAHDNALIADALERLAKTVRLQEPLAAMEHESFTFPVGETPPSDYDVLMMDLHWYRLDDETAGPARDEPGALPASTTTKRFSQTDIETEGAAPLGEVGDSGALMAETGTAEVDHKEVSADAGEPAVASQKKSTSLFDVSPDEMPFDTTEETEVSVQGRSPF